MRLQCSPQCLPARLCSLERALEHWHRVLGALRRWLGSGRRALTRGPAAASVSPRCRVVMHLHRTVVVDQIVPPPSPRAQPTKEVSHAQLPPQQS